MHERYFLIRLPNAGDATWNGFPRGLSLHVWLPAPATSPLARAVGMTWSQILTRKPETYRRSDKTGDVSQ